LVVARISARRSARMLRVAASVVLFLAVSKLCVGPCLCVCVGVMVVVSGLIEYDRVAGGVWARCPGCSWIFCCSYRYRYRISVDLSAMVSARVFNTLGISHVSACLSVCGLALGQHWVKMEAMNKR
jgi:hypothetical protein